MLAFGVTHHKSQGLTLDHVVLGTGRREANGGKTLSPALNRCQELSGILLEDYTQKCLLSVVESPIFLARLAALVHSRQIEDGTRAKNGSPALTQSARLAMLPDIPHDDQSGRGWRRRGAVDEGKAVGERTREVETGTSCGRTDRPRPAIRPHDTPTRKTATTAAITATDPRTAGVRCHGNRSAPYRFVDIRPASPRSLWGRFLPTLVPACTVRDYVDSYRQVLLLNNLFLRSPNLRHPDSASLSLHQSRYL